MGPPLEALSPSDKTKPGFIIKVTDITQANLASKAVTYMNIMEERTEKVFEKVFEMYLKYQIL